MGRVSGGAVMSAAQFAKRLQDHGLTHATVQFRSAATLRRWGTARAKLRTGVASSARIACIGDSKTLGAGAGTGSLLTAGAFAKSRPQRLAALLGIAGMPVRASSWFGSGGLSSIADVVAYDPRRSGFSGWSGGNISLGGPALSTGNANPGNFTPTSEIDRVSVFYRDGSDRPSFSVTKGAESTTITPSGSAAFRPTDISFTTKDAGTIAVTRTGGSNNLQLFGMIAWDSAAAGVEVINCGVYGVASAYQADASAAYAPLNALGVYAPDLTLVNLGSNDLNTGVSLSAFLASIQAIVTQAKVSGDCILEWPSIGGVSPAYGSDATRLAWRNAVRDLAVANGCLFLDEEALLGGRAAAEASGAFADSLHEAAWTYDLEAAQLAVAIG